jgi:beta-glucanase (GH16 family)
MKLFLSAFCVLAMLSQSVHAQQWKLVWSDEFDYEGLPDKKKWDYEEGFVRNREMQYYTRARKENARVEKGMLVIEGRKEKFKNPKYKSGSKRWNQQRQFASYTAASLVTLNKADWKYGRIEVRAKLPHGKGIWPAIWTLGTNRTSVGWPRCGEIDIMEFVGKDPNRVHANAHFAVNGKRSSSGGRLKTDKPYNDFHVYALEWNADHMDFFFDKTKYHTFTIDKAGKGEDNPFRKPHYLLMNLALGGSWGGPIDDAALPQKYLIDYVRVYKSGSGPQKPPAAKMVPLMDGKTLAGWHTIGGGKWTVEDGAFVGRAKKARLYGLLVSDKTFKNFIVSFNFKCLAGDSGFYIRTIMEKPDKAKGLQVQVGLPGSGAGGIYESYGRRWLDKPTAAEEKKILKADAWNKMTISAVGGDIVVRTNGVETAKLKNDKSRPKGHFALQMHSGNVMHVMFKDIKIRELP